MHIVALNVGLPRELCWEGQRVRTGIFKEPVTGPAFAGPLGLEGDGQADPKHHGGSEKAVYAYPTEHYAFWREELPGIELPWGAFGENLSTAGLLEDELRHGDRFRVGEALIRATMPREPCSKLGLRLGDKAAVKRFLHSLRSGVYFAVDEPGHICAGDAIERVERAEHAVSLRDMARIAAGDADEALRERCLAVPRLRGWCEKRLERG